MLTAMGIIQVIACVILICTVLLQKGPSNGLSGAISGNAETFYGKNKSSGIDAILAKITTAFGVIFVIMSLILCMLG